MAFPQQPRWRSLQTVPVGAEAGAGAPAAGENAFHRLVERSVATAAAPGGALPMDFRFPRVDTSLLHGKALALPSWAVPASQPAAAQQAKEVHCFPVAGGVGFIVPLPSRLELPSLPGGVLMGWTNFVSDCDPAEVLRRLTEVLSGDATVDYHSDQRHPTQLKGVVVRAARAVKFCAALYRGDEHAVLVDFQRRDGDAAVFYSFFREVAAQLEDVRVPDEESAAAADATVAVERRAVADALAPPTLEREPVAVAVPEPVLGMASSELVDVARAGCGVLAELSSSCAADMAADRRVWGAVTQALRSDDAELQRCAATTAANLLGTAAEAEATQSALAELLPRLAELLRRNPKPASLECDTARQLARALEACSREHADALKHDYLIAAVNERCALSPHDQRLCGPLRTALGRIHARLFVQ